MLCRAPSICRVHPFIPMYRAYFLLILTQNLCVKAHRCTRHTLPGSPNNELYLSASHLAASGRPFDFMQSICSDIYITIGSSGVSGGWMAQSKPNSWCDIQLWQGAGVSGPLGQVLAAKRV